jgi:hemerythrin-like domain-containing protein
MTDPIEMIKRDHREAERLFKEYEDLAEDAYDTKVKMVERLTAALRLHTDMEERIFYKKAKEVFARQEEKMVEEAFAEHDVAKRLLEELSVTHPEDPQFDARVKVLNENVAHHIKEEEQELLPKAEEIFSDDELNELGETMRAFRIERGAEEAGS